MSDQPIHTEEVQCKCKGKPEDLCQCEPCGCKARNAAPAAPVEGPLCTHGLKTCERCDWPAASPVREPPPECTCAEDFGPMAPHHRDCPLAAPAAPVREPGELTFAGAMALPIEQVEVRLRGDAAWRPLADVTYCRFDVIATADMRRKPAPPAPKPGRARAMAAERFPEAHWSNEIAKLAEDVAREALACVRRLATEAGYEPRAMLFSFLDAAAVALLGEIEVKRGG